MVHSPFLPNVGMVEDADLVMLSLAVAAGDKGLPLEHVVLLLLELGLRHLAVDGLFEKIAFKCLKSTKLSMPQ